jgi:hypothetical protein
MVMDKFYHPLHICNRKYEWHILYSCQSHILSTSQTATTSSSLSLSSPLLESTLGPSGAYPPLLGGFANRSGRGSRRCVYKVDLGVVSSVVCRLGPLCPVVGAKFGI